MKDSKYLILIVACIVVLSGLSYWRVNNFNKSLKNVSFPKIEIPQTEPFPQPTNVTTKEFVTPDGKLKVYYTSEWIETDKGILEGLNKEAIKSKVGEVLLFAHKFSFSGSFYFVSLLVQKINSTDTKEIFEGMKNDIEERKGQMEVLNLETEDKNISFEAKYKEEDGYTLYSKEKIFIGKENSYLVSLFAPEENLEKLVEESSSILSSVEFSQ